MGRLDGKKALVTGAASGLGAEISRTLASEGASIALTDIDIKGAQQVAEEINGIHPDRARAYHHDVTDESTWQDVLSTAANWLDGLSVLVNNAGIAPVGSVEDLDTETWHKVHAVDLDSVFFGCKHGIPFLREHAPSSIINIASISALIAAHNMTAYNSAKAGAWMLTKSVALHCARKSYGIRCNSVHPAFIDTPILDGLIDRSNKKEAHAKLARQIPLGHIGEPKDVALAVVYLASDESKFMTGSEIKLDGGISAM